MDTDGSFPWVKVAWGVGGWGIKLITHLHLLLTLKICEAIPMLSHITIMDWRLIKHKETSTFFLNFQMVLIYGMLFIYCNWVSTQWQWSVDLYKNRRETTHKGETIHVTIQKQYRITKTKKHAENIIKRKSNNEGKKPKRSN